MLYTIGGARFDTYWAYDNEARAYECFSKLFKGRGKDNDGDSIYDCFYKYGGARFDTYDLRKEYAELNQKVY